MQVKFAEKGNSLLVTAQIKGKGKPAEIGNAQYMCERLNRQTPVYGF